MVFIETIFLGGGGRGGVDCGGQLEVTDVYYVLE